MEKTKIKDEFRGDDANLCRSIKALIELSDAKALSPHGLGGHARKLLAASYRRLNRKSPVACLVSEPQHGGGFLPVLNVTHQSFSFGMNVETIEEADWYCDKMRTALTRAGCRVSSQNVKVMPAAQLG